MRVSRFSALLSLLLVAVAGPAAAEGGWQEATPDLPPPFADDQEQVEELVYRATEVTGHWCLVIVEGRVEVGTNCFSIDPGLWLPASVEDVLWYLCVSPEVPCEVLPPVSVECGYLPASDQLADQLGREEFREPICRALPVTLLFDPFGVIPPDGR